MLDLTLSGVVFSGRVAKPGTQLHWLSGPPGHGRVRGRGRVADGIRPACPQGRWRGVRWCLGTGGRWTSGTRTRARRVYWSAAANRARCTGPARSVVGGDFLNHHGHQQAFGAGGDIANQTAESRVSLVTEAEVTAHDPLPPPVAVMAGVSFPPASPGSVTAKVTADRAAESAGRPVGGDVGARRLLRHCPARPGDVAAPGDLLAVAAAEAPALRDRRAGRGELRQGLSGTEGLCLPRLQLDGRSSILWVDRLAGRIMVRAGLSRIGLHRDLAPCCGFMYPCGPGIQGVATHARRDLD